MRTVVIKNTQSELAKSNNNEVTNPETQGSEKTAIVNSNEKLPAALKTSSKKI